MFWVRKYARPDVAISDLPDLNERGHQYIGRSLVVEQAIQNGRGKVRVGDGIWAVEGPDAPAGARVTVVGAKGPVLVVERATGLIRIRARLPGSWPSSVWCCHGRPPLSA